jgi:uncharacterized protein
MARRRQVPVYFVANRPIYLPPASVATLVRVAPEPDEVDRYIVAHVAAHDLVITADIPLAAAVVDKRALAISPRGELYTAANVQERLAVRNLMQQLRSDGLVLGGPTALSPADCQRFAAALDRSLTSLLKARTPYERESG